MKGIKCNRFQSEDNNDFDYPLEISGLVSYMPKEDGDYQADKLKKYIKRGEDSWIIKS